METSTVEWKFEEFRIAVEGPYGLPYNGIQGIHRGDWYFPNGNRLHNSLVVSLNGV